MSLERGPQRVIQDLAEVTSDDGDRSRPGGRCLWIQCEIVFDEGGSGDQVKLILTDSAHGKVTFNAPLFIQHLSIGDRTDRPVHLVVGDLLKKIEGPRAPDLDLSKGGLVDDSCLCPHGLMFSCPTCSNQFGSPHPSLSLGATPFGANQLGRSQPDFSPKTALSFFRRE